MQVVVDIDGDGSFLMNCQELATAAIEKMDIKMFILNNQHLGMVVQWEDRFYKVRPPVLNSAVWPSQLLCQNPAWCVWCSRPWPDAPGMGMALRAAECLTVMGGIC